MCEIHIAPQPLGQGRVCISTFKVKNLERKPIEKVYVGSYRQCVRERTRRFERWSAWCQRNGRKGSIVIAEEMPVHF